MFVDLITDGGTVKMRPNVLPTSRRSRELLQAFALLMSLTCAVVIMITSTIQDGEVDLQPLTGAREELHVTLPARRVNGFPVDSANGRQNYPSSTQDELISNKRFVNHAIPGNVLLDVGVGFTGGANQGAFVIRDLLYNEGRIGRKLVPRQCATHGKLFSGGCFVVIVSLMASHSSWKQTMGYTGESKVLDCILSLDGNHTIDRTSNLHIGNSVAGIKTATTTTTQYGKSGVHAGAATRAMSLAHVEVIETATRDELISALCVVGEREAAAAGYGATTGVLVLTDPNERLSEEMRAHPCYSLSGAVHRVVDFFGSSPLSTSLVPGVRPRDHLSMAPNAYNQFLGYYHEVADAPFPPPARKRQCVLWGKLRKYYSNDAMRTLVAALALLDVQSAAMGGQEYDISLVGVISDAHPSALTRQLGALWGSMRAAEGRTGRSRGGLRRIRFHGVIAPSEYKRLLGESRCLIGLGDPLLGPSAVEAISMGSVYINPLYDDSDVRAGESEGHRQQERYPGDKDGLTVGNNRTSIPRGPPRGGNDTTVWRSVVINGLRHSSQHPHLEQLAREDPNVARLVCNYRMEEPSTLAACLSRAVDGACDNGVPRRADEDSEGVGRRVGGWIGKAVGAFLIRDDGTAKSGKKGAGCEDPRAYVPREYRRSAFVERFLRIARNAASSEKDEA